MRAELESWQYNTDLASLRDADALAKLPEAEQEAWRTFWAEVADILRQTEPKTPTPAK